MDKVFSFNGFGCSGENCSPVELAEPARRHPERRHHRLMTGRPTGSGWW